MSQNSPGGGAGEEHSRQMACGEQSSGTGPRVPGKPENMVGTSSAWGMRGWSRQTEDTLQWAS